MILDNDIEIKGQVDEHAQLLLDLKEAAEFVLNSEIGWDILWRIEKLEVWLQFHIRGRRGTRVTPQVFLNFNDVERDTVSRKFVVKNAQTIYDQVDWRLNQERLTWNEVKLDIHKEHIYDLNYMPE